MAFEVTTSINLMFDAKFEYPAIEQIDRIAAAGFKYLDFNFADWCEPESPLAQDNWKEWILEIKKHCEEKGLIFIQAHGPLYNIFGENTPSKLLNDKLCERSLEAAGILGIPWVVFHAGTDGTEFDTAHIAELKAHNMEFFTPLVKACEKYNTGIALENMAQAFGVQHGGAKDHYCSKTDDLIDLVDSFGSDRVGICWDTGHAHVNKSNQPYDLKKIGKRLKALHIQDNDGVKDQHLPPYHGTIDWNGFMKALHEIDYEGPFTFEGHTEVRKVPEPCKDTAMKLLKEIGDYLVSL